MLSVCVPADGVQQVVARPLLSPHLPADHGLLQPLHPAQFTCTGVPHPHAGHAAAAGRAARGDEDTLYFTLFAAVDEALPRSQ